VGEQKNEGDRDGGKRKMNSATALQDWQLGKLREKADMAQEKCHAT